MCSHPLCLVSALVKKTDRIVELNRTRFGVSNTSHQLRQLNSKFHSSSTYFLLRCNYPMLRSHIYYPYTTFTLCNIDGGDVTDPKTILELFKSIAMEVLKHANNPKISKKKVSKLLKSESIKKQVDVILDLFTEDDLHELEIYSNGKLNKALMKLTDLLSTPIFNADQVVADTIEHKFFE